MDDGVVRAQLKELLRGGQAHIDPKAALADVSPRVRGHRPAADVRSIWEELEHMRIAQEDILRYTLDPSWKSPEWTAGYWPAEARNVTDEMWNASITAFFSDLEEVLQLVDNPKVDLTATVPHGEWRTYLRQILLVADHNAYHLGQIVSVRRLLEDWPT